MFENIDANVFPKETNKQNLSFINSSENKCKYKEHKILNFLTHTLNIKIEVCVCTCTHTCTHKYTYNWGSSKVGNHPNTGNIHNQLLE